jgi:hypothetical protein
VDPPSVEGDGVACKRAQQQFQTLVGDLSTAARVDTHVLVFLWAVADSKHAMDSPLAEVVQHGHILGEPDRVLQR